MDDALLAALEKTSVLSTARQPELRKAICAAARRRMLRRVLPGVYVLIDSAREPLVLMEALQVYRPESVFVGRSAAGLLWGPEWFPTRVQATGRLRFETRSFAVSDRIIPREWVTVAGGLRCTKATLTAVDLIPTDGARFLDEMLRRAGDRGGEVLAVANEALAAFPNRRGNAERQQILKDSRDRPWSEAEREAHRQLRSAGVTGWLTNHRVVTADGAYFVDLAFPGAKVIVEIDGFEFHSSRTAFEHDRARHNALVAEGWQVLHSTWAQVNSGAWLRPLLRCLGLA